MLSEFAFELPGFSAQYPLHAKVSSNGHMTGSEESVSFKVQVKWAVSMKKIAGFFSISATGPTGHGRHQVQNGILSAAQSIDLRCGRGIEALMCVLPGTITLARQLASSAVFLAAGPPVGCEDHASRSGSARAVIDMRYENPRFTWPKMPVPPTDCGGIASKKLGISRPPPPPCSANR